MVSCLRKDSHVMLRNVLGCTFCFYVTATPSIYPYCHPRSLHDALPIACCPCARAATHHQPAARCSSSINAGRWAGAVASRTRPNEVATAQASRWTRSEEHTSELQSLMRLSYAVFCLKKKKHTQ